MDRKFLAVLLVLSMLLVSGFAFASLATANQKAVQAYEAVRDKYMVAKQGFEDAKQQWLNARDRLRLTKNMKNLDNAFGGAQNYMLKATDRLMNQLDIYDKKVDALPLVDENVAAEIKADIAAETAKLELLKADINSTTDVNQLREITARVKNEWDSVKGTVKRLAGEILAAHLHKVIEKANQIGLTTQAKINGLDANGYDTMQLQAMLGTYNSNVDLAGQKYEDARQKFSEITGIQDADKLFQQGHALIKEANRYLIEAHKQLNNMVREMRQLRKGQAAESSDENSGE
ncbi:MAG: hypothetical protein V1494_02820 [Candidatus Diapherotrites archaeon]